MLAVDRFAAVHFCSYSPCCPSLSCAQGCRRAEGFVRTGEWWPFADKRTPKTKKLAEASFLSGRRSSYSGLMLAAAGPFCPCVTSKETFWPSLSDLYPEPWIEL